jgi:putative phosphoesterase
MKILVISDTHKNLGNAIKIINDLKNIDRIFHLGDHVADAQDLENIFENIKIDYVKGNCDYFETGCPKEKIVEINGKKMLLTHGHFYAVKDGCGELIVAGKTQKVDAVLFGHTHIPYINTVDNLLLFNPGSIALGRSQKGETYGVIEVDSHTGIKATLHEIKK